MLKIKKYSEKIYTNQKIIKLFDLNHQPMSVQLPLADFNLRRSRSAAGGRCSEAEGE